MIDLSNKTAFITGASRGIGEAAARQLEKSGANVVLTARSTGEIDRIASELGPSALALTCDVANYTQVKEAVQAAISHFGGLDILVNNAGLIDPISRLESSDPVAWGKVIDVNLKGVYHCMHAAYATLKANQGVIINISSGAAVSALEGWSHYCTSKAALLSLTKCSHKEWASDGIRVVGLSPGTVATGMQTAIKTSGINPVSELDWSSHIPPEWVGKAIVWLSTDDAKEYDGTDFKLKSDEGRRAIELV